MFVEISVKTHSNCEFVDITKEVQAAVKKSGVQDGLVTVFCPHTTAAITINENADPSVVDDMLGGLERLVPRNRPEYRHMEGNSDAHIKSSMIGCSETMIVSDGAIKLGTWQGIYFAEFDGPRNRKAWIQVG